MPLCRANGTSNKIRCKQDKHGRHCSVRRLFNDLHIFAEKKRRSISITAPCITIKGLTDVQNAFLEIQSFLPQRCKNHADDELLWCADRLAPLIGTMVGLRPIHMPSEGMAVTCDHRIRSLATINKKTGFGSLVTTKCGHLRPQKMTFADRANKTQKCMRSLATTICGHLRPKIGIAWPGWVGWGWWGGMITYLALAHTLAEHIPCIHGWVGWVGWGGMIMYLALAHTLAEHIPCIHGWVGWVGWDDHVPCTCTHPSRRHHLYSWVGGVGGVG